MDTGFLNVKQMPLPFVIDHSPFQEILVSLCWSWHNQFWFSYSGMYYNFKGWYDVLWYDMKVFNRFTESAES